MIFPKKMLKVGGGVYWVGANWAYIEKTLVFYINLIFVGQGHIGRRRIHLEYRLFFFVNLLFVHWVVFPL